HTRSKRDWSSDVCSSDLRSDWRRTRAHSGGQAGDYRTPSPWRQWRPSGPLRELLGDTPVLLVGAHAGIAEIASSKGPPHFFRNRRKSPADIAEKQLHLRRKEHADQWRDDHQRQDHAVEDIHE